MVNSYGQFTPTSSDTNILKLAQLHVIEAQETHEGQVIRLVVDSRSDSSYVFYCCLRSRPIDPNVFYIMSDLTIAGPEKQILVRDAWLQSVNVNTIRGARLRGGWAAGHLGPWQHQQHFRLEGPRDPPAASRQPLAAVVAQEILEGGRGCCCARLCGPGNLRGGARCLVPGAWCADLMVCMCAPAPAPAAALSVELELLSE